ncbi:uncharacterized protein METZ01_LOCUS127113 [marine metagenome]|uniref:Uncharacterized protein n=1 Tax=marine metagenome TaxID=408172 RepID=A0A381YB00_9ZZZZ
MIVNILTDYIYDDKLGIYRVNYNYSNSVSTVY